VAGEERAAQGLWLKAVVLRAGAWGEAGVLVLPRLVSVGTNLELYVVLAVVAPNPDQDVASNLARTRDQEWAEYQEQAQKVLECSGHPSSPAVVGWHR